MFSSSAVGCAGSIRQQMGLLAQCDQEHIKGHRLTRGQGDALQREHLSGVIDQQQESSDEFCGHSVTTKINK